MKLHQVIQGSTEWLNLRANYRTASEAPAMMGVSKYQTRGELLKQKHTGLSPEVDRYTQAIFDRGHETEASARTLVEDIIGEDLYPVTCTDDADYLLASLDGRTFGGQTIFEHKLWSESLAAQVRAGELEPHYYWQLEQELLVSGAESVIFACSDGTPDKFVSMTYRAVPGRAEQLMAGWKQFDIDLANYVPTEAAAVVVATPTNSLPAVSVQLRGDLAVASNLPEFGQALREFIQNIPAKPETDQEFADAESACKALKKAEEALESAETHALAQMSDVEAMRRVVADLKHLARTTRLAREKDVAARKEQIRADIVKESVLKFSEHIATQNQRLGKPYMPQIATDFPGVIKGKRTIDSLREAVNNELVRAKIAANEVADRISLNMATLRDLASQHAFLFADTSVIVLKQPDDLTALVKLRIAEHQVAEEKRLQAERERIRAEEQAKAQREAQAAEQARQREEEGQRRAAEAVQAEAERMRKAQEDRELAELKNADQAAANVIPMRAAAPVAATAPTLKLGEIGERLGFSLSADFLANLGFEAVKVKNACLYQERDFALILMRLIAHIQAVQAKQAA